MQLTFSDTIGTESTLDVGDDTTVASVRRELSARLHLDATLVDLYLNSYRLKQAWSLQDLDIPADAVIFVHIHKPEAPEVIALRRLLSAVTTATEAEAKRALREAGATQAVRSKFCGIRRRSHRSRSPRQHRHRRRRWGRRLRCPRG
jgi:hypothetical protein